MMLCHKAQLFFATEVDPMDFSKPPGGLAMTPLPIHGAPTPIQRLLDVGGSKRGRNGIFSHPQRSAPVRGRSSDFSLSNFLSAQFRTVRQLTSSAAAPNIMLVGHLRFDQG
jgi:hypothetical protein